VTVDTSRFSVTRIFVNKNYALASERTIVCIWWNHSLAYWTWKLSKMAYNHADSSKLRFLPTVAIVWSPQPNPNQIQQRSQHKRSNAITRQYPRRDLKGISLIASLLGCSVTRHPPKTRKRTTSTRRNRRNEPCDLSDSAWMNSVANHRPKVTRSASRSVSQTKERGSKEGA